MSQQRAAHRFLVNKRYLMILLAWAALDAPLLGAEDGLAIVDVTVVPMDREGLLPGQTVLVEDGKIVQVGSTQTVDIPENYSTVDGRGRHLAPGLADMHAHPMTFQDLDLYLAAGVTLVRAMWGESEVLRLRQVIKERDRIGPAIITGGRIVDGESPIHYGTQRVVTPADAQRVVEAQTAAGYDFIKTYSNLSAQAFYAIANAAKEAGVPFAGHVPQGVAMERAIEAGMQTSEHLFGVDAATLADGNVEVWRFGPRFPRFAERVGSGDILLENYYDEQRLVSLARLAADAGHWIVPTLTVLRSLSLDPEGVAREWSRPEMAYTDLAMKRFWRLFASGSENQSPDYYRGITRIFEYRLHQVRTLHDNGARLMAGTDAVNPFVYTGFSVVGELELMVRAGLSPYDAIRTATVNVGEFIGKPGAYGVVVEGAEADLVLLEQNPLEDVAAYRTLIGVVVDGTWRNKADLDKGLQAVVASNKQKSVLLAEAGDWLLDDGEVVTSYAGFSKKLGEMGGFQERVAFVSTDAGGAALLAERQFDEERVASLRMELDDQGRASVLEIIDRVNQGHRIRFERNEDGFEVCSEGGEKAHIDIPTERILTSTAADVFALGDVLSDMVAGETRQLDAACLQEFTTLETCSISIERHGTEVLPGHFYFAGADRYVLAVTVAGETRFQQVWVGGGFNAGWPMRREVEDPETKRSTVYYRIL